MPYKVEFNNPVHQLKYRILRIQERLQQDKPKYMQDFIAMYPEYDTSKGVQLIRNVMAMVTTDEELTQRFEAFVANIKKPKHVA